MSKILFGICGPTASGKTGLAIEVAKRVGGEIVSADSMQIYKGMDILSAKPATEEMQGVRHHMIGVVEPTAYFSASHYREMAQDVIEDIKARGRIPILCGGTGLYIDAVTRGMRFSEKSDEKLRNELKAISEKPDGEIILHNQLREMDPEAAEKYPAGDVRRVIRSIEINILTGMTRKEQEARDALIEDTYDARLFALDWPRETLYDRIERRVDIMVKEGLINEDCFTLSADAGAALAQTSDTVGMFFSTSGTNVISGEKLMDYCVVEPWCNSVEVSNGIMRNTFVITNACEEPEKLISWLDYFFTEEGSLLVTLGVQGETYDIDENGNWYYIETDDQTADFIQGVLTANGGVPTYQSAFKLYQDAGSDPISAYSNTQRAIASKHAGLKMLELNFTDEDLQIGLPIMIDVNTYFPQYMASVMTGEMDLDDSWEEFQATLQAMQAPVLEEVLQGCYDRMGE